MIAAISHEHDTIKSRTNQERKSGDSDGANVCGVKIIFSVEKKLK